MRNIQLAQKFASDRLFEKLHRVSLSHWIAFADHFSNLTPDEQEEVKYVVRKISEWRGLERDLEITNKSE